MKVTNTAAPTTIETNIATDRNNPIEVKRKSLLNASYSSEEILLQAASSLQGLEGKIFGEHSVKTLAIFCQLYFTWNQLYMILEGQKWSF